MDENVEQKRTEYPTLRGAEVKVFGGAQRSPKQNTRGSIPQIATDPSKKVTFDAKINELIENDISIGDIKRTLQINEGHDADRGETSVELHEAVVRSSLGQEAVQSG